MANASFSPEDNQKSSEHDHSIEGQKPEFKRPEFIIIDDRYEQKQHDSYQQKTHTKEEVPQQASVSSLRFLCLLGFIFCFFFASGLFIWSSVITLFAFLNFLQNPTLNRKMRRFWKLMTHTIVVGLGFMVGLLSPTLGLSLIGLYFSMTNQTLEDNWLRKIFKRTFRT